MERYSRQTLFEPIGDTGQKRLLESHVTLIGCGALGSVLAETLARSGVGLIRIVDRDFVELNNLQRQVLFDEQDVALRLPKAEAARRKLNAINSNVTIEAFVDDANHSNIESLARESHLLLDGTDNFETRYLINDVAVKQGIPWIYGACVSATGLVMPIIPGETACLKCVFDQAPPPEMSPTCDTVGVLAPVVNIVASLQAAEALKILTGNLDALTRKLTSLDVWTGRMVGLNVERMPDPPGCPCCTHRQYDYLDGDRGQTATTLCGRDAVQINEPHNRPDLDALAAKLVGIAGDSLVRNEYMLQADIDGYQLTVFPTGRAIIKGTKNPSEARSVYSKYIGS